VGQKTQRDRGSHELDYPEHVPGGTFTAAERQVLNDRLRKSSLPPGYEKMPLATSADTLKLDHNDSKKS